MQKIPPPPLCFSCGRELPEGSFDEFHERTNGGAEGRTVLDELGFLLPCCRRMFFGDSEEHRRIMALYDETTLDETPSLPP